MTRGRTPGMPTAARPILPVERVGAALEVMLCSGFPTQLIIITILNSMGMKSRLANGGLSAPFVFALTLADTVLLVALVLFFLRVHHESPRLTLFGHASTRVKCWSGWRSCRSRSSSCSSCS